MADKNVVSIYKFATEKGVRPQYLYQKMADGKIPNNVYVIDAKNDQPFLIREKAEEWWQNLLLAREERRQKQDGKVKLIGNPKQVLQMVIEFFREAGKEQVAVDLEKVLDQIEE